MARSSSSPGSRCALFITYPVAKDAEDNLKKIIEAILVEDSRPADFAALTVPDHYRAVAVLADEVTMFDGLDTLVIPLDQALETH
jgi:hypothetical protein